MLRWTEVKEETLIIRTTLTWATQITLLFQDPVCSLLAHASHAEEDAISTLAREREREREEGKGGEGGRESGRKRANGDDLGFLRLWSRSATHVCWGDKQQCWEANLTNPDATQVWSWTLYFYCTQIGCAYTETLWDWLVLCFHSASPHPQSPLLSGLYTGPFPNNFNYCCMAVNNEALKEVLAVDVLILRTMCHY